MATWPWLAIAGVAAMGIAGLALALLGLRGRRLGDHPHCRKCGFDTFGSTGEVCTECGADLTKRRAVRIGVRQRRGGMVLGGLVLLLPAVLVVGIAGVSIYRGVDVEQWWRDTKPQSWLVEDALRENPITSETAYSIRKRSWAGELSDESQKRLVDEAIARQPAWIADWVAADDFNWREIVYAAGWENAVTPEQTLDLLRQSFDPRWGSVGVSLQRDADAASRVDVRTSIELFWFPILERSVVEVRGVLANVGGVDVVPKDPEFLPRVEATQMAVKDDMVLELVGRGTPVVDERGRARITVTADLVFKSLTADQALPWFEKEYHYPFTLELDAHVVGIPATGAAVRESGAMGGGGANGLR